MNNTDRNAWNAPTGHDTLLNGGLIAASLVGLLLAVLQAPETNAAQLAQAGRTSGVVVTEQAATGARRG